MGSVHADEVCKKMSNISVQLDTDPASIFESESERVGCDQILAALSESEKGSLPDDQMPLRHFRAEKGDVEKAIAKLKCTLKWRDEFRVSEIRDCFDEKSGDAELQKIISFENETGKIYARNYCKNGCAILYFRPGVENSKDQTGNLQHLTYNLERAIACAARKSGKTKINICMDFKGFKLRTAPSLSISRATLNILQNHYPERLNKAYICNPPRVFKMFWKIIYPFVDPVTKTKIIFCDGAVGSEKLSDDFHLDVMESCVGGTKKLRHFDSEEYLHEQPFDHTFDEE